MEEGTRPVPQAALSVEEVARICQVTRKRSRSERWNEGNEPFIPLWSIGMPKIGRRHRAQHLSQRCVLFVPSHLRECLQHVRAQVVQFPHQPFCGFFL